MNQTHQTIQTESRPGSARSVMYTPRTPRMRQRQRFDLSTRPEEDGTDGLEGLEDLVGQTWNIYAASALFGIEKDDVHFKLYSKRLREEIASTLTREDVTYDAKFSIVENITSNPNYDNPAIKIEVVTKIDDRERDVEKSIYKGILLSWRLTQTESNIQNSVRLPLLLCRGTRSCMEAVHAIIGRMFDCLVVTLPANADDLSWLIPIIITTTKEEEPIVSGEVQMEYTVSELPVTDTIRVKFHTSDLRKILSVIRHSEDQDDRVNTSLEHEHIEMFYEVLHKQMLMLGGLQLGLCTLHRINLPGVTIMENRMKVTNVEILNNILLYFSDKALDVFHTVHIDI
ncbi:PREDICTED: uncharacterized protein LOC105459182 [Wasmannia auropunctata]|uniref:uncharacterized protein LOC105459182 n=1 Tax=Wasmannia auropunctata TaxID=64793 RepID=UPI0005EFE01F|nr:PREDICTED: uncharacterized protein LOC105459182 [Wasmannia auropunctata]XP_011703292.1 PREDICTED: uncharacterized protein LOC105459182 [Wasmannia auropunctata]